MHPEEKSAKAVSRSDQGCCAPVARVQHRPKRSVDRCASSDIDQMMGHQPHQSYNIRHFYSKGFPEFSDSLTVSSDDAACDSETFT